MLADCENLNFGLEMIAAHLQKSVVEGLTLIGSFVVKMIYIPLLL